MNLELMDQFRDPVVLSEILSLQPQRNTLRHEQPDKIQLHLLLPLDPLPAPLGRPSSGSNRRRTRGRDSPEIGTRALNARRRTATTELE